MKIKKSDLKNQVPVLKCKRGHVIPLNGAVVNGTMLKTPRLVCEECARAAGGEIPVRQRKLKPGERIPGQENFLDTVPALQIGRHG